VSRNSGAVDIIIAISDKSRKILWGRSGNRCAICKQELIVNPTPKDPDSVVGEECHIVSGEPNGPRYDSAFPERELDSDQNLILLCRIHHKMVDDQTETYTAEVLRQMKADHEKWVEQKLTASAQPKPVRIRRVKENIPRDLRRLTTGKEVLDLLNHCCELHSGHDELQTEEEVELVGQFLQTVDDMGDISSELGLGELVGVGFELTRAIGQLERAGFWVFGAREVQRIEGGYSQPATWPVATMRVLRKTNPEIIWKEAAGTPNVNGSSDDG
jgi:hypothetical protein